ncbi:hypothetical protein PMZ80_011078 [Knufia obscura]|uniref:Uncharacterized protein n=2 Tax=Knufia TaxID=430999 RepID=A0AAN8E8P6_9EURO|nr:hypothetical protein PMZ80_011078 [Knufia obscura]KAK5948228.1 hypothetical protein OHC33_010776 [Knufia fluminis]
MLPKPNTNFTLPSLYDDLELDCRLYFPRVKTVSHEENHVGGCAIFAHPYAPLGGCYDDPVVHSVGSVLLRHGFVLATFNFRGAEKSAGRTSWSGKAELGDYVSVYAFMLAFINEGGVVDNILNADDNATSNLLPTLLLGGYSYGSMIAAHLPDIGVVLRILQHAKVGSAEHEIKNRAHELAQAFLGYCEVQQQRGRSNLKSLPAEVLQTSGATFGGYESPTAAHRISREGSRRSIDPERVRQSVDRVRRKLGSRSYSTGAHSSASAEATTPPEVVPKLMILLVSPLQGPVSSFATVFTKLKFERRDPKATAARDAPVMDTDVMLSSNHSLIVFGTDDRFTSPRKVSNWCQSLKARPGSMMDFREIVRAGHFWHDPGLESQMTGAVAEWLKSVH